MVMLIEYFIDVLIAYFIDFHSGFIASPWNHPLQKGTCMSCSAAILVTEHACYALSSISHFQAYIKKKNIYIL